MDEGLAAAVGIAEQPADFVVIFASDRVAQLTDVVRFAEPEPPALARGGKVCWTLVPRSNRLYRVEQLSGHADGGPGSDIHGQSGADRKESTLANPIGCGTPLDFTPTIANPAKAGLPSLPRGVVAPGDAGKSPR